MDLVQPSMLSWKSATPRILAISRSVPVLILAILFVNALARPYSDLIHDARLYSIQALDRISPGLYSDDLYLRYGSQDKFSAFSRLLAPLAQSIGLRQSFFVLYLVSNSALLGSAFLFFRTITRRRYASILATIYIAVAPIGFGGLAVFHVNETMLTPRLFAVALVLLALRDLGRACFGRSMALLIPAMMIHPVMAFGGLLVWGWCILSNVLSPRQFHVTLVAGFVSTVAILSSYPVASRMFGVMDPAWQDAVFAANFYATPVKWVIRDWFQLATAFAIVTVFRQRTTQRPQVQCLLDGILFVGSLAVLGGVLAPWLPYALPFQGQPYRALWILQLIQVPLLASLCQTAIQRGTRAERRRILLLLIAFAISALTALQLLTAAAFAACMWQIQFRTSSPITASATSRMSMVGLVASVMVAGVPLGELQSTIQRMPCPLDALRFIAPTWGPLFATFGAVLLLAMMHRLAGTRIRFAMLCFFGFALVQVSFFIGPTLPLWAGRISSHQQYLAELHEFLHRDKADPQSLPTVYWPQASLDDIWVDLRAKSFYTKQQTAGNMFHRETAIEGRRRAFLVAPFEYAEYLRRRAHRPTSDWRDESLLRTIGVSTPLAPPTIADLNRVCQESIDYVITSHEFSGLYSRKIGPLYVYNCEKIRRKMTSSPPQATVVEVPQPARSTLNDSL
jgi:hypothetical protein